MAEKNHQEAITVSEFVAYLGGRVTIGNVHGRIRRSSLSAYQDENGNDEYGLHQDYEKWLHLDPTAST